MTDMSNTDDKPSHQGSGNEHEAISDSQNSNQEKSHTSQDGKKKKSGIILLFTLLIIIIIGLILSHLSRSADVPLEGIVDTNEINISSKVTSRVDDLLVHEGDSVHKGQSLIIMSDPQTVANQQQAMEELARAVASKDRTDNGDREERTQSLKAQWLQAVAQERLADVSADRAIILYQHGVISTQQRDDLVAQRDADHEQSRSYHQQYLESLRGNRIEDKQIALADVGIAEAALKSAASLVQEMHVTAPVSGEIAERFANLGELISAGTPLYSMIDLNNLWVTVNWRENEYHNLKMGQELTGHIPALNNRKARFKVTFINPEANFATWQATRQSSGYDVRTFEVRLRPTSPIQGLRPGMTVLYDWPSNNG